MQRKTKALAVIAAAVAVLIALWGLGLSMEGKTAANEVPAGLLEDFDVYGSTAVFAYSSGSRVGIYTSDIAGKNSKRLVEAEEGSILHHPVFSPDGRQVLYVSTPKEREQQSSHSIQHTCGRQRKEAAVCC